MFTLFESFDLEGRHLVRSRKLRAHYDKVRVKQLRELDELNQLKLKASTPKKALECASRFRALLKKHTKQLNSIMDRLVPLMRSSMRDAEKKKNESG